MATSASLRLCDAGCRIVKRLFQHFHPLLSHGLCLDKLYTDNRLSHVGLFSQ